MAFVNVLRQCASVGLKNIPFNSLSLWKFFNNERKINYLLPSFLFNNFYFYLITPFPCLEAGNFILVKDSRNIMKTMIMSENV